MEKKLQRIPHQGAVAGVCAGLGVYFGVDKTWVRLAFIVSVFFSGYMGIGLLGPIVYIVLWIVLPIKSFVIPEDPFNVDYRTPENQPTGDYKGYNPYAWDAESKSNAPAPRASKDRYVAGVILLMLGLFFLFYQLNVFYWHDFVRYWPVFIIILGVATIFGAFKRRGDTPFSPEKEEDHNVEPESDQPANNTGDGHSYTK